MDVRPNRFVGHATGETLSECHPGNQKQIASDILFRPV